MVGPDGSCTGSTPPDREIGAHLCGTAASRVIVYWETADRTRPARSTSSSSPPAEPSKVGFSKTLDKVAGNARPGRMGCEEVARLKEQPGKDLAVGGAGLASTLMKRGLVDEFGLFLSPVVLGGGTPYFPELEARINLELVETRTFGSRVVYVRYRRV